MQKTPLAGGGFAPLDRDDPPRSIAVLPFENATGEAPAAELIRSSFYSHLSIRPYRDIELSAIDARLQQRGLSSPEEYRGVKKTELGRLLGCDAVVFGRVTDFDSLYAAVYSRFSAGAEIEIWDTRSGQQIWEDRHVANSHEGGVPLSLLEIPLVSIRSGLNLRETVRIHIVDELTRYLAQRVPVPGSTAGDQEATLRYALQAGAFIEPPRASALTRRLRDHGFPAFVRKNREAKGLWHRVILGPYDDQEEALRVQSRIGEELQLPTFIKIEPVTNAQ